MIYKDIAKNFGASVGIKFSESGMPLYFPGNTFICLLEKDSAIWKTVRNTQEALFKTTAGKALTALPTYSFHMTAIEGICDQVRDSDHWTSLLPTDTELNACNDLFDKLIPMMPDFPTVTMRIDHLRIDSACSIGLYPNTYADDKLIRDWRDEMSTLFGIKFPGHDRYGFHIGLGYGLRKLNADEKESLCLLKEKFDSEARKSNYTFIPPSPVFVKFDNMFSFGL